MRGPEPESWLQRPMLVAAVGFLAGAAIAGIVLFFVLNSGGSDNGSPVAGRTVTARPTGTPGPQSTGTVTPGAATPAAGPYDTAPDALAALGPQRFSQTYAGPCPESGAAAQGVCSVLLYQSDVLATYKVGHSKDEDLGEAVLQQSNGKWTLEFVPAPTTRDLAAGRDAIVYEAGDCLNFRSSPSRTADTLSCEIDGSKVHIFGGPQQAEGITWWQIENRGWASGEYLIPAP